MNLPNELINKIIMMNRPSYPYYNELNSYCRRKKNGQKVINMIGQKLSWRRGLRYLRKFAKVLNHLDLAIHSYGHETHTFFIEVTDSEDDEFFIEIECDDPYLDTSQPNFDEFFFQTLWYINGDLIKR